MKKRIILIAVLVSTCITSISCKKEHKSDPVPTKSPQELLTSGRWYSVKTTATIDGLAVTSVPEPCEEDNITLFLDNQISILDIGSIRCDGEDADPQIEESNYMISTDGKTLKMYDGQDTLVTTIEELTVSRLVLRALFVKQGEKKIENIVEYRNGKYSEILYSSLSAQSKKEKRP